MTGTTGDEELCQAVLGFVAEGTYPEDNVVASKFPAAALARELELISKARTQVEVWSSNFRFTPRL
jgi:centromere/kinetochore protein ZW10